MGIRSGPIYLNNNVQSLSGVQPRVMPPLSRTAIRSRTDPEFGGQVSSAAGADCRSQSNERSSVWLRSGNRKHADKHARTSRFSRAAPQIHCPARVLSPLIAANATLALNAHE